MEENIDHPEHYNSSEATCSHCGRSIECIDVVRHMNFNIGNAIKYLWRLDLKDTPLENLRKAIWYLMDEKDNRRGLSKGKKDA